MSAALLEARNLRVAVPGRVLVDGFDCAIRRANSSRCSEAMARASRCCCARWQDCARRAAAACGSTAATSMVLARRDIAVRLGFLPQDPDSAAAGHAARCRACSGASRTSGSGRLTGPADAERVAQRACGRRPRFARARASWRRCRAANSAAPRSPACWCRRPSIYLLDEPTNHLDPAQQLGILERLRALTRAGAAVIASLHDPNLALRFADARLGCCSATAGCEMVDCAALGRGICERLYGVDYAEARTRRPALHGAGLDLLAVADHTDAQRLGDRELALVIEPAVATFSSRSRRAGGSCQAISWMRSSAIERFALAPRLRGRAARPRVPLSQCAGVALRRGAPRAARRLGVLGCGPAASDSAAPASPAPRRGRSLRAILGEPLARVVRVHQRRDAENSEDSPAQKHRHRSASEANRSPAPAGAADRWSRARWWSRARPAAPARSVKLPPASSTMTVSAAMSRMFTSDSMTTSSAPRASRW